ncbi:NB-ARC domain-containing protein [Streptomyces kanasensis]|uniref:NB-ARC domain-containing protein n=1 Tax=Streptomyces kanasensis TaxID=936756 RepID=UPI003702FF62
MEDGTDTVSGSIDGNAPAGMRELATRLRTVLSRAGYGGIREVAEASGLSRSTVSDALRGNRATWATVTVLLRHCGVAPDASWKRLHEAARRSRHEPDQERADRHSPEPEPVPEPVSAPVPVAPAGSPARTVPGPRPPSPATAHPGADAGAVGAVAGAVAPGVPSLRAPYGELPHHVRGRAELLRTLEAADRERVHVLCGLGGSGKTTVALELARVARRTGHRVLWVSATTRGALHTGMRRVARELGVSAAEVEEAWAGLTSAPDLVWRALDAAERPWLLVLDNMDEPEGLTDWVRPGAAGLTVVTSRVGNPMVWGAEAVCHPVDVLSPEDGAHVLVDLAGQAGPTEDARALAERLGGLPLALRLAGAYLARSARGAGLLRRRDGDDAYVRDFAGYAAALDRLGPDLLDRGERLGGPAGDDERRLRRLVGRTWEMSLDLLEAQGLPEARLLLRLLSCFAPAPFPAQLLDLDTLEQSGLFTGAARAGGCDAALESLVDMSLVRVEDLRLGETEDEHDTGGECAGEGACEGPMVLPCLVAHPLVLEVSRLNARRAGAGERDRLWRAASLVALRLASVDAGEPGMWKVWDLLVPHLRAGLRGVPDHDEPTLVRFLSAVNLAHGYAVVSNGYDLQEELAALFGEKAAALPPDHPAALHARQLALRDVDGSGEGIDTAHALYEAAREEHGEHHAHTVQARHSLARALYATGDLPAAEREYRALVSLEDDGPVPEALHHRTGLITVLAELGKGDEATAQARALLSLVEEGRLDADDLSARHHLGHALDVTGLYADGERLHRRVLAELEGAGARGSHLHLHTTRMLAENLAAQQRHEEALGVLDGLLHRYGAVSPAHERPYNERLRLLDRRARLLHRLGRYDEVVEQLRRLLAEFAPVMPSDAPAALNVRYGLVLNLLHAGRSAEADAELSALMKDLGPEGPGAEERPEGGAALRQRVVALAERLDPARCPGHVRSDGPAGPGSTA